MENHIYRYSLKLEYKTDKDLVTITHANIQGLMIDYDYDNKNIPVMYFKVALDRKLLDNLRANINKKTIIVTVSKYIKNTNIKIEKNYIKGEFVYFMDSNVNTNEDLDYNEDNKKTEVHNLVTIGMTKLSLINNNKRIINDVFTKTTLVNMICKHTTHMKLLIEPFKNNSKINSLIIPPVDSITKFIKYLNEQHSFYSSRYRLFYDFDKTYLMSSSGKPVPSVEETFNSIIFNIENTIKQDSKVQGVKIDNKQKAYIINIDTSNINIFNDQYRNASYDNIVGIGQEGTVKKVSLDSTDGLINKPKITRIRNSNMEQIDILKKESENNTFITITKEDIDTSIFTINKEYHIKNYDKLKDNNGRYLLLRKREIYSRHEEEFILTNVFTFKKIK